MLQVRDIVNKVLEQARMGRLIGANMDAKALLFASNPELAKRMRAMVEAGGEGVDRLRFVLLTSQVRDTFMRCFASSMVMRQRLRGSC